MNPTKQQFQIFKNNLVHTGWKHEYSIMHSDNDLNYGSVFANNNLRLYVNNVTIYNPQAYITTWTPNK